MSGSKGNISRETAADRAGLRRHPPHVVAPAEHLVLRHAASRRRGVADDDLFAR